MKSHIKFSAVMLKFSFKMQSAPFEELSLYTNLATSPVEKTACSCIILGVGQKQNIDSKSQTCFHLLLIPGLGVKGAGRRGKREVVWVLLHVNMLRAFKTGVSIH